MLPDEISNIICSYIESPTNKIIKDLYFDPIQCLKLNRKYNFKHIHIPRLLKAINEKCPDCLNRLSSEEYLHKKMCFSCLERQHFRQVFELSQLIIFILLFYIVVVSLKLFLIVDSEL
jgi:hypothetical protein